jgi:hypothetical protein
VLHADPRHHLELGSRAVQSFTMPARRRRCRCHRKTERWVRGGKRLAGLTAVRRLACSRSTERHALLHHRPEIGVRVKSGVGETERQGTFGGDLLHGAPVSGIEHPARPRHSVASKAAFTKFQVSSSPLIVG